MSVISSTKPDQWTLSPQMTAAPELWRDAVVFPFWEGIGIANAIGSTGLTGELQSVDAFWESYVAGAGVRVNRSTNNPHVLLNDNTKIPLGGKLTITVALTVDDVSAFIDQTLFAVRGDNSDNGYALRLESGNLILRTYGGNTGTVSSGMSDNTFHAVSAVWDEGSNAKIYRDGELLLDVNFTDGNPDGASWSGVASYGIDRENINPSNIQGDTDLQGRLFMGVHHFNALNDDQISVLHRDIYAMLRPAGF